MKLIKINDENIELMSFDEVVQQFDRMIKKHVFKWVNTYDRDDLTQEALLGLWKAYKDYDITKGTTFTTVAYNYIHWGIVRFHQVNTTKKLRMPTVSLQTLISDDSTELEQYIGENETFTESTGEKSLLNAILEQLNKEQRQMIELYVMGYNQSEIAEIQSTSKQVVNYKMKAIFDRARTIYIKSQLGVS